jgi:hypothetical protein
LGRNSVGGGDDGDLGPHKLACHLGESLAIAPRVAKLNPRLPTRLAELMLENRAIALRAALGRRKREPSVSGASAGNHIRASTSPTWWRRTPGTAISFGTWRIRVV